MCTIVDAESEKGKNGLLKTYISMLHKKWLKKSAETI